MNEAAESTVFKWAFERGQKGLTVLQAQKEWALKVGMAAITMDECLVIKRGVETAQQGCHTP